MCLMHAEGHSPGADALALDFIQAREQFTSPRRGDRRHALSNRIEKVSIDRFTDDVPIETGHCRRVVHKRSSLAESSVYVGSCRVSRPVLRERSIHLLENTVGVHSSLGMESCAPAQAKSSAQGAYLCPS